MAIRTTSQTGNWSSSSTWGGNTPPGDGDRAVIGHAVTVDTNITVGDSPHQTHQSRPTIAATGSGGSLPAGAYTVRIVAVSSYGETTYSACSTSVSITSGQVVRVTLPTLPAGATSWSVYLTNTNGGTTTQRRYATGQSAGTFDCSSSLWMDGTDTYTNATALPSPSEAIAATAKITIPNGIILTCKGPITTTADIQIDATTDDTGIEFDSSASPSSGAASYRLFFGTVNTQGTGTLITTWTGTGRPFVRAKTSTTYASIQAASQTSTSGNVRLNLNGTKFSNLGAASVPAISANCTVASFQQNLTDVIFDTDCRELLLTGAPATSGWQLTRVACKQTSGNTYSSRECCISFQCSADANVGVVRNATYCSFDSLPVGLGKGGATYDNCYFNDCWANLSTGIGGSASSIFTISNSFVRKLMAGAGGGTDTINVGGNTDGNYLYIDNVTGPTTTDLNPHGIGCPAFGVGTTITHQRWVIEYNLDDDSGDMFKSPTGAGTVALLNNLIVPNRANKSTGTIFTFPNNPDSNYRLRCEHNTYVGGPYSLSTSEGGPQPAGTISSVKSNLVFSIDGTAGNRYVIGKADGNGSTDTTDVVAASDCSHNAGWNLEADGFAGTWYQIKCTGTPGSNDVDLGDSAGADISTNGPQFFDPTRKFITWAEIVLSATGTDAQKITTGLNALKAIADTTSVNHVPGLLMTDPANWVRDGFAPGNELLRNAGHDSVTIGAMEMSFGEYNETGSGGTVANSTSVCTINAIQTSTGGTVLNGTATVSILSTFNETGSGGTVIAGDSLIGVIITNIASGGIVASGTASLDTNNVIDEIASGGITAAGTNNITTILSLTNSGGCVNSGTAFVVSIHIDEDEEPDEIIIGFICKTVDGVSKVKWKRFRSMSGQYAYVPAITVCTDQLYNIIGDTLN